MAMLVVMGALMVASYFLSKSSSGNAPPLKRIHVSSSTYGHMIPITHGTPGIGGNWLWFTDLIPHDKQVGGKGGGGGGTLVTYTVSGLISWCEVPFGKTRTVQRIWANGKLIYDNRPGSKKKQKYNARITNYDGGEDQLPDPYYEAHLGGFPAPAYRGQCCSFFQDLPLKDLGESLPQMMAEVVESFAPAHSVSLITGFTQGLSVSNAVMLDPREDKALVYATQRGTIPQGPINSSLLTKINAITNEIVYEMPALDSNAANGISSDIDNDGNIYSQINYSVGHISLAQFDSASGTLKARLLATSGDWHGVSGNIIVDRVSTKKLIAHITQISIFAESGTLSLFSQDDLMQVSSTLNSAFGIYGGGSGRRLSDLTFDKDGNVWCLLSGDGSVQLWKDNGGNATMIEDITSHFLRGTPSLMLWFAQDNSLIIGGQGELVKYSLDDMAVVDRLVVTMAAPGWRTFHCPKMQDTIWLPDVVQDSNVSVPPGSAQYFPAFQEIDLVTLEKKRFEIMTEAASVYPIPGYTYFAPIGAQYDPTAGVIWSESFPDLAIGKFSVRGAASCVTLQSVIEAFCEKAGYNVGTEIDALACGEDLCCGLGVNQQGPVRGMLEPLLLAHGVDVVDTGEKLIFKPRTAIADITIPQKHIAAYELGQQPTTFDILETRKSQRELPRSVKVNYFLEYQDYETGSETAIRAANDIVTVNDITIEFQEVFTPRRARQIAQRILDEYWMGQADYEVTLMPEYMRMDPGDVAAVNLDIGLNYLFRISELDIGDNFLVKAKGVAVDSLVYKPPAIDAAFPQPPNGGIPIGSSTILAVIDSPAVQDADNGTIGPYLAVAPELGTEDTNWQGAVIFRSSDGSAFEQVATLTTAAMMGHTITALPAPANWTTWDETSTLTIRLYNGEPQNYTRAALLSGNGAWFIGNNINGWEVAQAATATQIDANTWTLSGPWTRGRRGTEWAIGNHAIGDQVVFIEVGAISRLADSIIALNKNMIYRAVSIGDTLEDSVADTEVNIGRSLMPYAPDFVRASRNMSGDIELTWLRRSRYSAPFNPLLDPILGEDSEKYRVYFKDGTTIKATREVTSPTVTYLGSDQTTDYGSLQDPIEVSIVQVSASVGNGFAADTTV